MWSSALWGAASMQQSYYQVQHLVRISICYKAPALYRSEPLHQPTLRLGEMPILGVDGPCRGRPGLARAACRSAAYHPDTGILACVSTASAHVSSLRWHHYTVLLALDKQHLSGCPMQWACLFTVLSWHVT